MAQATRTQTATDITTARRRGLPPGPQPLPVVGHAFQFRRDPLAFVQGLQRSYGGMATFYMGKMPMVLLARPEYARYVLVDHARNFTSREFAFGLRGILGDGLLTSDGDFHRQQRRLVQPAFHKKRVEGYAQVMVAHTQQTLDEWQVGQRLDIAAAMQDLTLRIVAKALFDVDLK
ncbi:MAG TPA: cytochrome P450, partial [Ktedonobacterales bacterium]|nr:cytochrome P450 [Ktedonobacterales bacterium]